MESRCKAPDVYKGFCKTEQTFALASGALDAVAPRSASGASAFGAPLVHEHGFVLCLL